MRQVIGKSEMAHSVGDVVDDSGYYGRWKGRPMRVMFLGLRGFPDVQGGVETHAEHLCPQLHQFGCDVEVIVRAPYVPADRVGQWKGVRFLRLWAPPSKGLEAILHTALGVLVAAVRRPDILHIQAIGPALMVPLARLFGLRVVVTHHGPDYDRQKWGRFAKTVLRLGERFGMRYAHGRIVISRVIADLVKRAHGQESALIPNGVVLPEMPVSTETIDHFRLEAGKYVLLVSRLVPEKRHLDLIQAFNRAAIPGWKLVIVGASDHPDAYVLEVLDSAKRSPNIVCTGLQIGNALRELYGHAGIFVLPSSHEGLPIALLEALSYGLPVIASDIPANLEVGLPDDQYFPLGDVESLANRLLAFSAVPQCAERVQGRRKWVSSKFDWQEIARKTADVYRSVLA